MATLTLQELKDRLAAKFDEVTILELLDLRSQDLVDRFEDIIEQKRESLAAEFDDDDEFSPGEDDNYSGE